MKGFASLIAMLVFFPATARALEEELYGPQPEAEAAVAPESRVTLDAQTQLLRNQATLDKLEEEIDKKSGLTFFGAGPGVTLNLANRDRVEEAHLDENGIIRLTKQSDASAGIFLEAHYLWETNHILPFITGPCKAGNSTKCGFGPFVGVQPGGSSEIIEGIGAGFMFGLKGTGDNIFNSTQFNVGVGVFVDPNVKTLGAGQYQDQPLPAGETVIRYQEDFQANFMIVFTVNPF